MKPTMPNLLCVYCSSSDLIDRKYFEAADALGRGMVARGWGLIYGGGHRGLMGTLARAVKESGGHVVGVIPEFMKTRELAFNESNELVTVTTMRQRKQIMEERAAGFVTLPGGIGTLEELAEIMTLRYLNQLPKPVIIVNQGGYYDDLLRFFERMKRERFKSRGAGDLFNVADSVEDVWRHLDLARPFVADDLWQ